MIHHAVTHLDPDIRTEAEANYSGHFDNIPQEAMYKTRALQKLLFVARQAEVKVCGIHNFTGRQTTQALITNNTTLVGSVEGLTAAACTSAADASSAASTMSSTSTYCLASQADNNLR